MAKKAKQSKSKMVESAELTQALMSCPGLGIYIVQDGKFQYANSLFQELTGYTEQELRSIYPLDLVHPEDRELVRDKAIENLKGHSVLPYEYRFIKKNGDIMWNLERLASIEYMGKQAAVGSFMDITASKWMAEALAKSEEKYRTVLEGMGDSYYEVDLAGNFTFFNDALCRQMGYSREELMGMNYKVYTPPEDIEKVFHIYSKVYRTGEPVQIEMEEIRKDGTRLFVENSVLPLRNESGEIIGTRGIGRDVTERKQTEEALAEEAIRRRVLMERSIDGISVLDEDSKLIEANQQFAEMLGYSPDELKGLHSWDWDTQWTREELLEMGHNIDEAGAKLETLHRRKDGTLFDVEISVNSAVVVGKKLLFCVSRDITERKRAEEALRRSEENFRDSMDSSPLGIRILDKDGRILYANRVLLDMWGYASVEELEAVPAKQLYTSQAYAEHRGRFKERKRGERGLLNYETSIVRSDGQVRHLSASRAELLWGGEECFQVVYQDITARKRAEEALRHSEQNFRDSMENSPLGIRVLDSDGKKTVYANRALLDMWGYSSVEEIEAVPGKQRYTPEGYAAHVERLGKRKRGEPAPLSYETSILRSDGQVRIMWASRGEVLWNGEKRFQIVYQDITESKQAEEALRRSEENFRDSIENSPLGIRVVDKDDNTLYANRALLDTWGYGSIEELEAVPKEQRYTSQTYAEHLERVEKRKRGEPISLSYDTGIVRSDGQVRILSVSRGEILWNGEKQFQVVSQDITEYRQLEEALRRSEERYRTVLEQMEEAYYETDIAGKFTFCNDAMCRQLGYSMEELMGMSFKVLTPPEDMKRVFGLYNEVYCTGEPFTSVPIDRIKKDGTQISVESSIFPLRNESGEIIGFRGLAADVTERKKAEEALRRSEERYRTVLEQMEEAYFETDLVGNYTFVNDALCRQSGYSREELIGMSYRVYTPEDEVPRVYKAFNRVYETEKPIKGVPMGRIKKDGTRISTETSAFPLQNESGEIMGFRGITRDVTERVQMIEALSQSEERYRTILAEIQEGYYETDLAGNFTFVNDAICSQLGYSREELIGTNYQDCMPKEEVKGVYKAWNKVYRTGEPLQSYPFTGIRKDKRQIFLEASVSPSRNNEGKIIGFRSISRDVTEREQYEKKLKEMATHDALTGLPNRTLLSDRFTVALALSRRTRNRLAVLMLDLDRFKAVNDSMGHDVGDKLLKAVGKRLEVTMRKSDTVARIGGDEFVLVLPQIPHAEEATKFAQRILDAFREPFVFGGHRLNITTSVGIAVYPEGGKDIESLLKSADTAMYWAKEQGRDIYKFYDGNEAATLLAKRRTV